MGAWGGWALAPDTASIGRDNRSHRYLSRKGRQTFKRPCGFFNFFGRRFFSRNWFFGPKLSRGGPIGLAPGRFVGGHGGSRLVQRPANGNVIAFAGILGVPPFRYRPPPSAAVNCS